MQSALYTELKAQLNTTGIFKYIALWNRQIENEKNEKAFNAPACLVEFNNMTYADLSQGIQRITGNVILHCIFHTWKPEDDLTILTSIETISQVIHLWTPLDYAPFSRIDENQDFNHSSVVDWQLTYHFSGTIMNSYTKRGQQAMNPGPALDDSIDLIIDSRTTNGVRTASPTIS